MGEDRLGNRRSAVNSGYPLNFPISRGIVSFCLQNRPTGEFSALMRRFKSEMGEEKKGKQRTAGADTALGFINF